MINRSRRKLMILLGLAGRDDRGDSNVEMIIVFPVFVSMFFLILQGAVWLDASNVAQAAATSAYNSARDFQATPTDGTKAGYDFINSNGTTLQGAQVDVSQTATTVTVTVTGQSVTLIPGLFATTISRTVTGPLERWVN